MATQRLDDKHDVTIRSPEKLAPGRYKCEVHVGLTDGSITDSSFIGEGRTPKQAERVALRHATIAIKTGKIKYRTKE